MQVGGIQDPVFATLKGSDSQSIFQNLPTPAYVVEESQLIHNGKILASVMQNTGCKILLAQKAFSNFRFYPLLQPYLSGTEASGLFEARLGAEEMPGKEVHVFCGAYRHEEFTELLQYADHIVFNSPRQLQTFGHQAKKAGKSIGLRINPLCSTQEGHAIYDPCAPGSRLGTTLDVWKREMTEEWISILDGLHFHTLCQQDADALAVTVTAVEEQWGDVLPRMNWLNLGGGHHITRPGYNLSLLEQVICQTQKKWNLQVYLEPGEAVALNAGYLVSRVLDIVENSGELIAILDSSAACHMPDVIEMPYTPPLYQADDHATHKYILGGPTCLSGDVIGRYCFHNPLQIGDILVFGDMAIYTTCKNNTFNGMPLPNIYARKPDGLLQQQTNFGYSDFKIRLG